MADTLTASFICKLSGTLANAIQANSAGIPFDSTDIFTGLSLTDGTTANKADVVWYDQARALTGTTPEDIDMYDLASLDIGAGAGKGPLGNTYANVEIVLLLVTNDSTSTGNIYVGGKNAGTAWNSFLAIAGVADDTAQVGPLKPGGGFAIWNPADPAMAVADTTNHLLTITPTANATYNFYLIGRSA